MPFHWKLRMPDDIDKGVYLILYICVGLDVIVLDSIDAPYQVTWPIIAPINYIWHQDKNK